jgi:anti-anti-sigma factor
MIQYSLTDRSHTVTLNLRGALDALSSPDLGPVLNALVDERRDIVVDLSALRMLDSVGVLALLSLYMRVRAHYDSVGFRGVTAQPLLIFKLLHLDVMFGLTPNPARTSGPAAAGAGI